MKQSTFLQKNIVVGISILGLILLIGFQNCSGSFSPDNSLSSEAALDSRDLLNQKGISVLTNRCASCHNPQNVNGNISNITDINYLLFYRLVIPGQPEISDVIRTIKEGRMPPDGKITSDEVTDLTEWIKAGLTDYGSGVKLPGGATVLEAKFSSIQSMILVPKCVACHNATRKDGGVDVSTYDATMMTVKVGNPDGSSLITSELRTGTNYMPIGGARLSADEIAKMKEWIMSGAMND